MYTVRILYVYCTYTVRILYVYCTFTVRCSYISDMQAVVSMATGSKTCLPDSR